MGRCSTSTPTSSLTSVCSENVCCYARRMQPFISTTHEPTKAIMGTLFVSNASLETSPLRTLTSVFNWRKHFMNRGFHGHTCEWNPFSRASQWMRGLSFHPCECASLPRVLWTCVGSGSAHGCSREHALSPGWRKRNDRFESSSDLSHTFSVLKWSLSASPSLFFLFLSPLTAGNNDSRFLAFLYAAPDSPTFG